MQRARVVVLTVAVDAVARPVQLFSGWTFRCWGAVIDLINWNAFVCSSFLQNLKTLFRNGACFHEPIEGIVGNVFFFVTRPLWCGIQKTNFFFASTTTTALWPSNIATENKKPRNEEL